MIEQVNLDLITAWNKLNKINNRIDLKKTLIATRTDIKANKLKEILVQCSVGNNDLIISLIHSNDKDIIELGELYMSKYGYEKFIFNEIKCMKASEEALCVGFLKEYEKLTWKKIAKRLNFSERQCQRYYYDDYLPKKKGITPKNNVSN